MTDEISLYGRLSPWKPEALAGFKVGDLVDVASLGRCRITALIPPSLVELQTEHGGRCRCGWRALTRVPVAEAKR